MNQLILKTTALDIHLSLISNKYLIFFIEFLRIFPPMGLPFGFPKVMLLWQGILYMEISTNFIWENYLYSCIELGLWGHASSWSLLILSPNKCDTVTDSRKLNPCRWKKITKLLTQKKSIHHIVSHKEK